MHVYVIINMHEHMALLTEGNRSNSQQLSCTTRWFNCKYVCVVAAACISIHTVAICNHSVHIHLGLLLYYVSAVSRSLRARFVERLAERALQEIFVGFHVYLLLPVAFGVS